MEMERYALARFNRKTGKIDTTLEAESSAMLELWALQNTTKTKDSIIFCLRDGSVVAYAEGTPEGIPNMLTQDLGNINDYCSGLLEVCRTA